jgi:hypothetical protein
MSAIWESANWTRQFGHDDHTCVGQSIINTINDTCVHLEFTLESLKLREIPNKLSKYMHV